MESEHAAIATDTAGVPATGAPVGAPTAAMTGALAGAPTAASTEVAAHPPHQSSSIQVVRLLPEY